MRTSASTKPMRPWIRRAVTRVLAFAISRRPDRLLELRHVIDRAFPHRCPQETGEIWRDASQRAGIWPD
jgi:hypothetical protein